MTYTVLYEMYRKDGMSREEFADHLTNVHAPIIAKMPQVRSYTILPVNSSADTPGPEPDGFSVLSFDSEDDFNAMLASPAMEVSTADAATFVGAAGVYFVGRKDVL